MTALVRDFLLRAAKAMPKKIAFYEGDRSIDWATLNQRANLFAKALQKEGIGKGDVVGILSHEHIEIYEAFHGCLKLGAPRVGINWRFSPKEMLYVIKDSNAKVVLVQANCVELMGDLPEKLASEGIILIGYGGEHELPYDYEKLLSSSDIDVTLPEIHNDDLAAISYTSGTTGSPKGVLLSQVALREAMMNTVLNLGLAPNDVWYAPTSSAWITFVLITMNTVNGMTSVLPEGDFDPDEYFAHINKHKVTVTIMVPIMMRRLIQLKEEKGIELPSLRLITYGSSPSTPELIRRATEAFGCDMSQLYGVTEATGGWICVMSPEDTRRGLAGEEHLLRSCGRPTLHFDVEIRDDKDVVCPPDTIGEIWLRSDSVMTGYLGLEEQTNAALQGGWLCTNDLGYIDEEGFLYLTDRKNNLIITGSANVFPSMVENVLDEHENITEVAVVGVPHPEWDEAVVAVIIAKNADAFDSDEVIAFSKTRMAKFEVPKALVLVDDLPKGLTGKVLKKDIQAMFKDGRLSVPWDFPSQ
ncbi:MAG: AMP-binding protein [Cycloclasticus sp.]|nr:CoA ligase [Cycloclasticus sp. 44_32_T64]